MGVEGGCGGERGGEEWEGMERAVGEVGGMEGVWWWVRRGEEGEGIRTDGGFDGFGVYQGGDRG